jgi:hypothetical protein
LERFGDRHLEEAQPTQINSVWDPFGIIQKSIDNGETWEVVEEGDESE